MMRYLAFIFLFVFAGELVAQEKLTLPDIYKNGIYRQNRFGPIRWMKDGLGYSSIEKSAKVDGEDIVRYDALSGKRSILIAADFYKYQKRMALSYSRRLLSVESENPKTQSIG